MDFTKVNYKKFFIWKWFKVRLFFYGKAQNQYWNILLQTIIFMPKIELFLIFKKNANIEKYWSF
jgi:hypothetical protein